MSRTRDGRLLRAARRGENTRHGADHDITDVAELPRRLVTRIATNRRSVDLVVSTSHPTETVEPVVISSVGRSKTRCFGCVALRDGHTQINGFRYWQVLRQETHRLRRGGWIPRGGDPVRGASPGPDGVRERGDGVVETDELVRGEARTHSADRDERSHTRAS
jgi:hypothetical protein